MNDPSSGVWKQHSDGSRSHRAGNKAQGWWLPTLSFNPRFPLLLLSHSDTSPFLAVVPEHLMEHFALLIFIP